MYAVYKEKFSNESEKTLRTCEDGNTTGLKSQICEDKLKIPTTEKMRLFSTEKTSQKKRYLTEEEGRQWRSGESKEGSSTKMALQNCEDEGRNVETTKLFFTNGLQHLTDEDKWKWRSDEREGMGTRLIFGYRGTKWTTMQQKQFPGDQIEVPRNNQEIAVSLGVESDEEVKRVFQKESNHQASHSGYHFEEDESEKGVVETQTKEETAVQIHNAVESTSKSDVQRRSRKGTPNKRPRDDFTKWKEQSGNVSETNGLVSRGSSPENDGYDNWLNRRQEHMNMCSNPEHGSQRNNREYQTSTYQEESDCQDISDEETGENFSMSLPFQKLGYQNGNRIQSTKCSINSLSESNAMAALSIALYSQANVEDTIETKRNSFKRKRPLDDAELGERISSDPSTLKKHRMHSQELSSFDDSKRESNEKKHSSLGSRMTASENAENEVVNVTDSWVDVDVVPSSAIPINGTALPAVHSTILKEHNVADRLSKGIPLYLPGRQKWTNTDESFLLHKYPSLFVNQNEERQFLPVTQHGGGHFADPRYPWGYFSNIVPMQPTMYPVKDSERMRSVPWAPSSISPEGGLQLKGSLEKEMRTQSVQMKRACPSDCHSQNGEYDCEGMDGGEHTKHHAIKQQKSHHSQNGLDASEGSHRPVTKKYKSRRSKEGKPLSNPWGNETYSDLITMALLAAPGGKMTLDEIYRWITINVPYFRDKGEELSSTGWKNSIRHTLSVRQRFVRLPRILNGIASHKSWWSLSDDFLQKRSVLEPSALTPSLQATKETQATQGTQTEEIICGWCSCPVLRK